MDARAHRDVLSLILARVPLCDVFWNCTRVCRTWHEIIAQTHQSVWKARAMAEWELPEEAFLMSTPRMLVRRATLAAHTLVHALSVDDTHARLIRKGFPCPAMARGLARVTLAMYPESTDTLDALKQHILTTGPLFKHCAHYTDVTFMWRHYVKALFQQCFFPCSVERMSVSELIMTLVSYLKNKLELSFVISDDILLLYNWNREELVYNHLNAALRERKKRKKNPPENDAHITPFQAPQLAQTAHNSHLGYSVDLQRLNDCMPEYTCYAPKHLSAIRIHDDGVTLLVFKLGAIYIRNAFSQEVAQACFEKWYTILSQFKLE